MNADTVVYTPPSSKSRRGDWFQTYTGRQFWPLDPRPGDFDIADIAHGLANIGRFGGHTRKFYSVAQHSIMVSYNCSNARLQGLMHDAPEAYLGDMVRPLKYSMPEYLAAERAVWDAICRRYALPIDLHPEVKIADNRALVTERRDLMSPSPAPWAAHLEALTPYKGIIVPERPSRAEREFLLCYETLTGFQCTAPL